MTPSQALAWSYGATGESTSSLPVRGTSSRGLGALSERRLLSRQPRSHAEHGRSPQAEGTSIETSTPS